MFSLGRFLLYGGDFWTPPFLQEIALQEIGGHRFLDPALQHEVGVVGKFQKPVDAEDNFDAFFI